MTVLTEIDVDNLSEFLLFKKSELYSWKTHFFLGPLNAHDFELLKNSWIQFAKDFNKKPIPYLQFFEAKSLLHYTGGTKPFQLYEGKLFCLSKKKPKTDWYPKSIPESYRVFAPNQEEGYYPVVTHDMVFPLMDRLEVLGLLTVLLHHGATTQNPLVFDWVRVLARWLACNMEVNEVAGKGVSVSEKENDYIITIEPSNLIHPYHDFFNELVQDHGDLAL